jgi:hypothetical protein
MFADFIIYTASNKITQTNSRQNAHCSLHYISIRNNILTLQARMTQFPFLKNLPYAHILALNLSTSDFHGTTPAII